MNETSADQKLDLIYQFIQTYIVQNGFSPSLREISDGCYVGRSTVLRYLDRLAAQGLISRQDGKARSIHLTEKS